MLKTLSIAAALFSVTQTSSAEALSQTDRDAILLKLEKITKAVDDKLDARFNSAKSSFSSAVASPNAALELYLKCTEKVNFEDMKRKEGEFREWKRAQDEMLSDPGFRLALQYQLNWLILTLEAVDEKNDRKQLAAEAARAIDSVAGNAEALAKFRNVMEQDVMGSVFAKAYEINNVKPKNWPTTLGQVKAIYESVILPPLREAKLIEPLREAWKKRITQEGILLDAWAKKPNDSSKSNVRTPELEKFISDEVPNLRWEAEQDLFKAGDQRAAAIAMLNQLEEHPSHPSALKWTQQFITLIKGK
jgi:hypothetical protein